MKKLLILLSALLLLILGACGSSDVSTGGEGNSTEAKKEGQKEEKKVEEGTKTIDATSQTVEAAGMKVGLGEIKISKDKIEVGVNLENTSDGVLHFYPDQGSAVIGDMQIDSNMFMTDGDLGGEVQPSVKQDGVLQYLAPDGKEIDVNAISEIKLIFGEVNTDDYMTNEKVEFTVPVK
ncbi:hypothetical protein [Metabacillus arenae]|uniref:DUF4352 domain-containing protein n=1 Tax=Metabacillus arenae TaxID=2771434 RepID=A0A926NDH6_9BACI|nr:hypothetical protein [Metabacillus arenae]MBD1379150.1 hypothetical protein [Metabacillus arenae]